MAYTPDNNPYIPGDPYSYDLKWQVDNIKHMQTRFGELDEQVQEATDQADRAAQEADRATLQADNAADSAEAAAGSAEAAADSEAAAKDYADNIADPVSGLVTTWLNDHISPGIAIDNTLSVAGAAADAKVTGDKLALTMHGSGQNLNSTTGADICSNDLNNLANNAIYTVQPYAELLNAPSTNRGLLFIMSKQLGNNEAATQFYLAFNAGGDYTLYARMYSGGWRPWLEINPDTDTTLSIAGAPADAKAAGDAIALCVRGGNSNVINSTTGPDICNNNLNNIFDNKIYNIQYYAALQNNPLPANVGGSLFTFSRLNGANENAVQICYCNVSNAIGRESYVYMRQYRTAWTAWQRIDSYNAVKGDNRNITASTGAGICGDDLDNIPFNTIFGIVPYAALQHSPTDNRGLVIKLAKSADLSQSTMELYVDEYGSIYTRAYWSGAWQPWACIRENSSYKKVLVLGDSLALGSRNNNKGFIGDLHVSYTNKGVGGATLQVREGTTVENANTNIAHQMTTLTESDYDCIVACGGINDYMRAAAMGSIPTQPIRTDEEYAALNFQTVMGGLQALFYLMIKNLPTAQRYFVITHRTNTYPWTANSAGYTQTELHDAIAACAKLYGVKIIDVFNESMLNTAFNYYKSRVPYSEDPTITNTEYCDNDGVHPTALGYLECYVPLVKQALQTATPYITQ